MMLMMTTNATPRGWPRGAAAAAGVAGGAAASLMQTPSVPGGQGIRPRHRRPVNAVARSGALSSREPGCGHVLVAVAEVDRAPHPVERLRAEAQLDAGSVGHLHCEPHVLRGQLQREGGRVVAGDDLLALHLRVGR